MGLEILFKPRISRHPLYTLHDAGRHGIPRDLIRSAKPSVIFANEEEFDLLGADADHLIADGSVIVRTMAGKGSEVFSREGNRAYEPYKVDSVDPTGAGDAFAAGYIHADLNGWDHYRKVRFANACGALATTAYGASVKKIDMNEVLSIMKSSL